MKTAATTGAPNKLYKNNNNNKCTKYKLFQLKYQNKAQKLLLKFLILSLSLAPFLSVSVYTSFDTFRNFSFWLALFSLTWASLYIFIQQMDRNVRVPRNLPHWKFYQFWQIFLRNFNIHKDYVSICKNYNYYYHYCSKNEIWNNSFENEIRIKKFWIVNS